MSNTKLKEGLGAIAREVAVLPGVTVADASSVGEKVLTITAKIDRTDGLDVSGLPGQVASLNPPAHSAGTRIANGSGLLGALADLPLTGETAPGVADWLDSIGIAAHECELDDDQGKHSTALNDLHGQTCGCATSVKQIDDTADRGMQDIVDVLLGLIAALKNSPLVRLGKAILGPICEGLHSIESTVDDRNESISACYENLRKICEETGGTQPPEPKRYSPAPDCPTPPPANPPAKSAPETPAPPAPAAPQADECSTTPAQAHEPAAPPKPSPSEAAPAPKPAPECPPSSPPAPVSPAPPAPPAPPVATPAPQITAPASTSGGLNISINVNANLDCPQPVVPQTPEVPAPVAPPVQTTPASCPSPAIPAPPAVPPVGPAGDCVVKQVVAGIEAFGQSVAECLAQIECPVEPVAANGDCPQPEPEPEPVKEPEPDCPEPEPVKDPEPECPEPEPEPAPEPEPVKQPECPEETPPEPAAQPECDEKTITPPPELAEVKEPPPPPKKGLVAPMAVSGEEPIPEAAPAPEPAPDEQGGSGEGAVEPHADEQDDKQRARKTGEW